MYLDSVSILYTDEAESYVTYEDVHDTIKRVFVRALFEEQALRLARQEMVTYYGKNAAKITEALDQARSNADRIMLQCKRYTLDEAACIAWKCMQEKNK